LIWIVALNFIFYVQADDWGLNESSKGLYESIIFISFLAGPYFWTYIADRYGRMKSFKNQIYVLFVGAAGMTFSFSLGMFIVFASLMCFAIAGELALGGPVYKEFIPASRSSTMVILIASFNVGYLICASLAIVACDFQLAGLAGWRWMCIVLLVIEVGFILLRLNMRETPFFLASQGRFEETDEVLNIVSSRQMAITNTGHPLNDSLLMREELKSVIDPALATPTQHTQPPHKETTHSWQFLRLFYRDHLCTTLTFGAVRPRQFSFMLNIPLVGMALFMPEILAGSGSNIQSCSMTFIISSIQQAVCIPANFTAYKLVDTRLGRRWCIVIFTTLSGVFMFSFLLVTDLAGVTLSQIIVVSSLCLGLSYMGQSAFSTLVPETFSTEIRSTGAGWIVLCLKIGSLVSPFLTGVIISSSGVSTVIILYAVLMIGCGMVGLAMKETRGNKTL
jgi:putative MFS transporter